MVKPQLSTMESQTAITTSASVSTETEGRATVDAQTEASIPEDMVKPQLSTLESQTAITTSASVSTETEGRATVDAQTEASIPEDMVKPQLSTMESQTAITTSASVSTETEGRATVDAQTEASIPEDKFYFGETTGEVVRSFPGVVDANSVVDGDLLNASICDRYGVVESEGSSGLDCAQLKVIVTSLNGQMEVMAVQLQEARDKAYSSNVELLRSMYASLSKIARLESENRELYAQMKSSQQAFRDANVPSISSFTSSWTLKEARETEDRMQASIDDMRSRISGNLSLVGSLVANLSSQEKCSPLTSNTSSESTAFVLHAHKSFGML
jgi:hypothetical protein